MSRWYLVFIFIFLGPKSTFAQDSRLDLYEVGNQKVLTLANATVALVHNENIEAVTPNLVRLLSRNYGEKFNLCSSERFREQGSVAFCSGSLVAPGVILTAAHCVPTEKECQNISAVFGFNIENASGPYQNIKSSEVYQCAEIIHGEDDGSSGDFALIKLARVVNNHLPLTLRRTGNVASGETLMAIGHPSGLPTKISMGTVVDTNPENYFVANLETYQGSSGSPVFDLKTGIVEGLLVRGSEDFVPQNSCMVSNPCLAGSCGGEDVTRISEVLPYLAPPEEVTFSDNPAGDAGVLHKADSPCAHSLSNLKALCSF